MGGRKNTNNAFNVEQLNELEKYEGFTQEEENLLAPYLIEASVEEDGFQEMVFEFPNPNPLTIDLEQIEKRFRRWEIEQIMSEPHPWEQRTIPKVIATKITVSN